MSAWTLTPDTPRPTWDLTRVSNRDLRRMKRTARRALTLPAEDITDYDRRFALDLWHAILAEEVRRERVRYARAERIFVIALATALLVPALTVLIGVTWFTITSWSAA